MKVCVLGMGKSGQGAAKLLLSLGHEVAGWDEVPFHLPGVVPYNGTDRCDLAVISPGIPRSHPMAQMDCEVIGEVELAFRLMKNRCIGVTGTNGKTTLTLLITHVLNHSGIPAKALGNIGQSLADYVMQGNSEEVIVAELSSFQLETVQTPALDYGVILNITPDHLDRYASFEDYAGTKCHLGNLVKKELIITESVAKAFAQLLPRRQRKVVNVDSYLQLSTNDRYCRLIGQDTILCMLAICEQFGIPYSACIQACQTFQMPQHRIEYVTTIDHVHFYNDSKGTNVAAVIHAVSVLQSPIYLIAGGSSKQDVFAPWKTHLPGKVKAIFSIGETASQIQRELHGVIPVRCVATLEKATEQAFKEATSEGIVLLSPGCASFDQFSNYEERGERFKECVFKLKKGKASYE